MTDQPGRVLEYSTASAGRPSRLRTCANVLAMVGAAALCTALVTKRIALSREDPFNNPWPVLSFAAQLSFAASWALLASFVLVLRLTRRSVHWLVYSWLTLSTIILARFFISAYRFVNP
jgi:hypothetical protein